MTRAQIEHTIRSAFELYNHAPYPFYAVCLAHSDGVISQAEFEDILDAQRRPHYRVSRSWIEGV